MRLAFFSPLNPQKSGISDYSEELLPHLARHAEIDLFVDGFRPVNESRLQTFRSFDFKNDPSVLDRLPEYDAIVYHMGNDPRYHTGIYETMCDHPGVVIFHDFAFQFFFFYLAYARRQLHVYLDEMEACHGLSARQEAEAAIAEGLKPPHLSQPLAFPLNLRLAQAAEAIVVHSEWSRSRFEATVPSTPVIRINMHAITPEASGMATTPNDREGCIRIAAFGHATPEKGIERALNALARLKQKGHRFHFTMVGEASPFFDVRQLARERELQDQVTITGYVTLDEFKHHILATDIAINLREGTVGETSASLCRIMAAGVPAIVSDVGWFSELPDDAVVKIDANECADALLEAYLAKLMSDADLRAQIGANARRYMLSSHSVDQSAEAYISFIRDVMAARTRARFVKDVSHELAALGINDRDEELLRAVACNVAEIAPPFGVRSSVTTVTRPVSPADPEKLVQSAPDEATPNHNGRLPKPEGVDFKQAAREYPRKLDASRSHYLRTKPFDDLAKRPKKYQGDGLDSETHRLFCDFANITRQLSLPPGSRILDVGCGSGWLSEYCARLGYDVCGIDISADLIEIARERLLRVPYGLNPDTPLRCRFEIHDVEGSPLAETFDAIICYDSLHHFEDERAVIRHMNMMLNYGGWFFVLEGERPAEGSTGEVELIHTMHEFGTLESPFERNYLLKLLKENGFAVVGDYISVNGFFQRELVKDARVGIEAPEVTYLLCKKVAESGVANNLRDSREADGLRARLVLNGSWTDAVQANDQVDISLTVHNSGSALWLVGPAALKGSVMLGVKVIDETGRVVFESHGEPALGRSLAPGEHVDLLLKLQTPNAAGVYQLKIDMVAQHVCWFEQCGSAPLRLPLNVK